MKRLNGARTNQGKASRAYPIGHGLKSMDRFKTIQIKFKNLTDTRFCWRTLFIYHLFMAMSKWMQKKGENWRYAKSSPWIYRKSKCCLFVFLFFQHSKKLRLQLWSTRINVFSSFIDKIIEYESQFEFVGKTLPGERGGVDRE